MAHVFSNEDGSIGTIILVSATDAERFVPENATYHGDLEIPEHDYPAALIYHPEDGIIEDLDIIHEIKIKEVHERHDALRSEFRLALHDAQLEGEEEHNSIIDSAKDLKVNRDIVLDHLADAGSLEGLKSIDHLKFDHIETI